MGDGNYHAIAKQCLLALKFGTSKNTDQCAKVNASSVHTIHTPPLSSHNYIYKYFQSLGMKSNIILADPHTESPDRKCLN